MQQAVAHEPVDRYEEAERLRLSQCWRTPDAALRCAIRCLATTTERAARARAEETLLNAADELESLRRIVRWNLRHRTGILGPRHDPELAGAKAELPVIHTDRWTQH